MRQFPQSVKTRVQRDSFRGLLGSATERVAGTCRATGAASVRLRAGRPLAHRLAAAIVVAAGSLLFSGCACCRAPNRPLTNALDAGINPQSSAAQIALAPVAVPVGSCSLALDAAVIHPVSRIPRAAESTWDEIWRNPTGGYVWQAFVFVPKLIATPFHFAYEVVEKGYFDW